MTQPARGPWPVDRRGALVVVGAALLAWILLPTAPNYDTATHLVWARELLEGRAPAVDALASPTLHPLWLVLAVPMSLSGVGASLMQLVAILSFAVVVACAYRLAADIAGRLAGLVAAVATASSFALILLAFKAYVDLPFLALVLTALVVERAWVPARGAGTTSDDDGGARAAAPGRSIARDASNDRETPLQRVTSPAHPLVVPILFLIAGLLRPEAWAFGVLFLVVRVVRGAAWREVAVPAVVVLAAPVIWSLADLLLSGDPLHSLTGTRALAEELGRPTGLASAPKELLVLLGDLARPPIAAAGVLGVALAVRFAGWRPLVLPLVVLGAGAGGFILVGALGLPLLQRYLLVPAVLLCMFAGVAAALVIAAALNRPVAGPLAADRLAAPLPSALRAVSIGALVLGFLSVGGYLVVKADSFRIVAQGVLREARWHREAAQLLDDPRVVAQRCGPITLPTYRFVPELTLRAGLDAGDVVSRATELGGAGPQATGVALVIEGDRAAKVRLGWAAGVPRTTNAVPPGFTVVARRGPFVAAARCE